MKRFWFPNGALWFVLCLILAGLVNIAAGVSYLERLAEKRQATAGVLTEFKTEVARLQKELAYYTDWRQRSSWEGWYAAEINCRYWTKKGTDPYLLSRWKTLRDAWLPFKNKPDSMTHEKNMELYKLRVALEHDEAKREDHCDVELITLIQRDFDAELHPGERKELFRGEVH